MDKYYEEIQTMHKDAALRLNGIYDAKNSQCPKYHWAHTMMMDICYATLKKYITADNVETVLDVGCGNGDFLIGLQKRFFYFKEMVGCDFTPEMVVLANKKIVKKSNINFVEGNILSLPFLNKKFDLTICINTLQVIKTEDLEQALSQLNSVTKQYLYVDFWVLGNIIDKILIAREGTKGLIKPTVKIWPVSRALVIKTLQGYGFELLYKKNIFCFEVISPKQGLFFQRK